MSPWKQPREHDRNGARAAHDEKAVGTRLGDKLRRPAAERTTANKERAIDYATYRALIRLFPEDNKWITDEARKRGVDPMMTGPDPSSPAGVGNAAAAAVIKFRRRDGANQHGDEVGGIEALLRHLPAVGSRTSPL